MITLAFRIVLGPLLETLTVNKSERPRLELDEMEEGA